MAKRDGSAEFWTAVPGGVCVFALVLVVTGCGPSSTSSSANDDVTATGDVADNDTTGSDTTGGDAAADTALGDTISGDGLADTNYTYGTCAQVADCVRDKCKGTDATCATPCLTDAPPTASGPATELFTCVKTKCTDGQCKSSPDSSCMTDCISLRCMPQIFTCIDDGKTGNQGCADVKTCFDTCNKQGSGVFACLATCYSGISADGKAKAKPFAECVANASGPGDPAQYCMKETLGCFLDGKTGVKGCYDSIGCLAACDKASDGFTCVLGCMGQMTKPAQDAYTDVAPCLGKDITATAGCEDQVVACLAPTATQTCAEALGCVFGCGQGGDDPTCVFTCLHNTTAEADKLLLEKLGCDAKQPACIDGIMTCIAPAGTSTCPQVLGCAMGCTGSGSSPDLKCIFQCLQKGSKPGATAAYSALNCMGKTDAACLDAQVACYQPGGTNNCTFLDTCVNGCYQGSDPSTCAANCLATGSAQSVKDFLTWQACRDSCKTGCNNDNQCIWSCAAKQCPAAFKVCGPA